MALPSRWVPPALCAAAFLSGAAALVFETLWFRQAGLVLGNAVWSTSLVLAAFMAGLALGNGLGGRFAPHLRRPFAAYAGLELAVGATGAALVALLPRLPPLLLPLLQATADHPALLSLTRAGTAFLLLLVPATAMGLTLPVLVAALQRDDRRFGWTLGRLYGWNTAGAVAGTLLGEFSLIPALGLRGAGFAAAVLNLGAAALALAGDRAVPPREVIPPGERPARSRRLSPALAAAFLAGGILLALEVVWFRLLLLTAVGTTASFAVMLAAVLAGIAAGGLLGALLARRLAGLAGGASVAGFLAGASTVLTYASFPAVLGRAGHPEVGSLTGVAAMAVPLMLPTCVLSGLLFTLLGEAVRRGRSSEAGAAGLLTLANTLGAMVGALAGGFLLLPGLGVERSVHLLALCYAGVGLLVLPVAARGGWRALVPAGLAGLALAAALALFPFGLMGQRILPRTLGRWVDLGSPGLEVLAAREGLTETAVLVRRSRWGTPVSHRLITNAISMSAVDSFAGRYMRAFVWLPVALHPRPRRALLVSYGAGSTAAALRDTASLDSIDVVDVSRNVIDVGRAIFPAGSHPLDDPRVRLHVEDGRFFLLATRERFDLITAEPPPPNNAGISTLYSREYFGLVRARLADGGLATHWLPAYQMREADSRAVAAAFCSAFPDCTLWSGSGAEWILLGTRDAAPVDAASFARQWSDPRVRPSLVAHGFESPEGLSATFLAGSEALASWIAGAPPVVDDHPYRISPRLVAVEIAPYLRLADPRDARERFARSSFVSRVWPTEIRRRALEAFATEAPARAVTWVPYGVRPPGLGELHAVLAGTRLRTGAQWMMGSDAFEEAAARGATDPESDEVLGIAAMADRDYAAAERLLSRAQAHARRTGRLVSWRVLARCLAGDRAGAAALAGSAEAGEASSVPDWSELLAACGLPPS